MTDIVKFGKFFQKCDKLIFPCILAVAGGVLRHEHELLRRTEALRLGDQLLHRIGAVFPADARNQAVRAVIEAPVRDLQVFEVGRRGDHASAAFTARADGVHPLSRIRAFQRGKQLRCIGYAQKDVPLRERGKKFRNILFGQTARDDDLFQVPRTKGIALYDRLDRLLSGGVEKGTGVDDQDLRLFGVVRNGTAVAAHFAQQPFPVHAVLVAAERDHAEYFLHQLISPYFASKSSLESSTARAFAFPSKGVM